MFNPNIGITNQDISNLNKAVLYDIITKTWLYDKHVQGYASEEECKAHNVIKVHTF